MTPDSATKIMMRDICSLELLFLKLLPIDWRYLLQIRYSSVHPLAYSGPNLVSYHAHRLITPVAVIFVSSDRTRLMICRMSRALARCDFRGTVPPGEAVTAMRTPIVVPTDTGRAIDRYQDAMHMTKNDAHKLLEPI